MVGGPGMARVDGRADWERGEFPCTGNRTADGKQYRLQRDRIGRRQRHESARMVPHVHW
jgi:hypothetical protein